MSLQKGQGTGYDKMKYEFMQEIGIAPTKDKRNTKTDEGNNKGKGSQKH